MSVRNGTTEWGTKLYRTANVPSYDAAYTVMLWFRIYASPASYSWADLFSLRSEDAGTWYFDELGVFYLPGTGIQLYHNAKNNATIQDVLGSAVLSTNTWYCAALVRASDTDRRLYIGTSTGTPDLALDATLTSGVGSRSGNPAAQLAVDEARSGQVDICAVKVWTRALTLAQLQAEQPYFNLVDSANCVLNAPITNTGTARGNDLTGTGNLTTAGTVTDQTNPSLATYSSGTNVTVTAGAVIAQAIAPAASVTAERNVSIAAGGIVAHAIAPAASAQAVQNVSVAAEIVVAMVAAPDAAVDAAQNVTIEAEAVIAFGMAPAGEVDAIRNVTVVAGSVMATGIVGDGAVSTSEVINATIEVGAVIAVAIGCEATVMTEISVAVPAGACVAFGCIPDGSAYAEMNITIAAETCLAIGLVGQAAVNQETMVVTIDMTGETHTIVSLEGELHTTVHVSGEMYAITHLDGELHTAAHVSGEIYRMAELEGEI